MKILERFNDNAFILVIGVCGDMDNTHVLRRTRCFAEAEIYVLVPVLLI